MESLCERTTTIAAPVGMVWSEICTLPQLLTLSPEVDEFEESETDGAKWYGRIAWGPVRLTFSGIGKIDETISERYLKWSHVLSHPRGMSFEGVIALSETASNVTRLTYRAMFLHEGRLAFRLFELLGMTVDDHVRLVVQRIKGMAEQHWQAQVRLGGQEPVVQE